MILPDGNINKRVGFQIKTVSNMMKRYFCNSDVKNYADNLTGVHSWIIRYLYHNREKEIFQRDIEEQFNIRRSTVSSTLALMEKNGLIVRNPVERDARLKKITLTQKAVEIHFMLEKDLEMREKTLIEGINEQEIESFLKTLEKIKINLEKTER